MADRRGRRLRIAALYIVALVLGVASAWLWLTRVGIAGVDAGIWRVNLLAGSTDADAYTRARIALAAVLALDRSETLYYTTDRDDTGALLRAECTYRLQGTPPPARWWSVTAYAADHFLFANEQRRYSVSGDTATIDEDGRFSACSDPPHLQILCSPGSRRRVAAACG